MNDSPHDSAISSSSKMFNGAFATRASIVFAIILFVLAALSGGDVSDRGLLPLVRFISLLMLVFAVFTTVMVGRYCAYSRNRWLVGQAAAGCIGLAGGFVWSATAFGFGFVFFMIGTLICALLTFKVMERSSNRYLARRTPRA